MKTENLHNNTIMNGKTPFVSYRVLYNIYVHIEGRSVCGCIEKKVCLWHAKEEFAIEPFILCVEIANNAKLFLYIYSFGHYELLYSSIFLDML
jgi:hypothetical protein